MAARDANRGEGLPWASQWRGPEHIIFGHDARRGLQRHPFATGLDTGCVYGNELTAAVFPALLQLPPGVAPQLTYRLVSVRALSTYEDVQLVAGKEPPFTGRGCPPSDQGRSGGVRGALRP